MRCPRRRRLWRFETASRFGALARHSLQGRGVLTRVTRTGHVRFLSEWAPRAGAEHQQHRGVVNRGQEGVWGSARGFRADEGAPLADWLCACVECVEWGEQSCGSPARQVFLFFDDTLAISLEKIMLTNAASVRCMFVGCCWTWLLWLGVAAPPTVVADGCAQFRAKSRRCATPTSAPSCPKTGRNL